MALIDFNKLKKKGEESLISVKSAAQKASSWVKSASFSLTDTASNVSNNVCEFAVNTIVKLIHGVNIDSLLGHVEKYGQEKGKDVSSTVSFLNKLKDLQKNGD